MDENGKENDSSKGPHASPAGAPAGRQGVFPRDISAEMREAYLDYAMSVITARALPDVRDGLKPVHRRILYTMHELNLHAGAKTRKSAKITGDVTGNYHPHGTIAVYDAMVKMAQDFGMRYPLVIGQGNFGSVDGDSAAAERYTEAKLSRLAAELMRDIDKGTVNWRPNYEGTRKEPVVLPAVIPNLLLNGTLGIAVGMATNIPPHNLGEVIDASVHLIENPDAGNIDLLKFVKGPDFPTGGLVFGAKDIGQAYATGKGGVVTRGEAEITEGKSGFQIIITSIPYRVNKADLISKIADLVREKKLEGVRELRDESAKDMRIVIGLRSGAQPQKALNYIYKHTQLEESFHYNMVALVDGVPETLSLRDILKSFIGHRQEVVKRRSEFDLKRAEEREHILLGLKKALDHIDKIIKLIRGAKDVPEAKSALMKEFKFSDKQADAILEMRLQKLAGLERQKVEDDLKETQGLIKDLKELLASSKKISKVIKDELEEIKQKYADERKSKVIFGGVKNINIEDTIPEEESVLVLTAGGYLKRTDPGEYRKQRRGGVGALDLNTKEEDFVTTLVTTSTHSDLLFFTDRGRVYQTKMYDVPEGKRATRGKSIMNFLSLADGEKVTSIMPMPKESKQKTLSLAMVTRGGVVKKTAAEKFREVRRSGLVAIKLAVGDELAGAFFVEKGDSVILSTALGQSIRFKESDAREMGRSAGGVRAMKLGKGDYVIGAASVSGDKTSESVSFMVISEKGFGKRTKVGEYKVQKRGGSGIKTAKVTPKTGKLIISRVIKEGDGEIVAISKKSQVIKVDIKEIPTLGRQTQGVRIMKLREGDGIASLICL